MATTTKKTKDAEVKVEVPVVEGSVDTTEAAEVEEVVETSDDRKSRGKDPVVDETWEYRIVKSSLSSEQIQVVEENELDVPTEWYSIQEVYMDGTGAIYDHTQDLTLEAETLNDLNDMIGNITKALNLPVVDGFPVEDELDGEEEDGDYDDPVDYEDYEDEEYDDDEYYEDDDEYYEDDDDYEYEEYDEEDPEEEEYEEEPEVEEEPAPEPEPEPASKKSSPKNPTTEDNSDAN
jgi:hypothetical protein